MKNRKRTGGLPYQENGGAMTLCEPVGGIDLACPAIKKYLLIY
jgi:hypothetical protein